MSFEVILQATFLRVLREGDVAIDVGAHSGFHASKIAEKIGKSGQLFAFEPLKDVFAALLQCLHQQDNSLLFNMALGKSRGVASFTRADGALEESGLRPRAHFNHPEQTKLREILVWCDMLDHLLGNLERLDYIKIDVEGGEMDVLAGGQRLIQRTRPLISIEYGAPGYSAYGSDKWSLWHWAAEHDYKLYDINGVDMENKQIWDITCDGHVWDFWAVPIEKVEAIAPKLVAPDLQEAEE